MFKTCCSAIKILVNKLRKATFVGGFNENYGDTCQNIQFGQ